MKMANYLSLLLLIMQIIVGGYRFGANGLSMSYYIMSCPFADAVVKDTVNRALEADPTLAAALVRMHFHDCFIEGCDGSILIDSTDDNKAEKDSPGNLSLRGYEVIDDAKEELEKQCPGVVSCADIIAMAARDAVFWAGGPIYEVPKGRKDGRRSKIEDTINLPFPTFNASELVRSFGQRGFTPTEMVALSGAHTLGVARCSSFKNRLSNADPTLDSEFAKTLSRTCKTALLCRHAKLSILPNQQATDEKLSTYATAGSADTWESSLLKLFFEKHPRSRKGLLIFVLLGTCMAIGDGVLTPTISVLSAVSGVRIKITELHENYVVIISCVVLVGLFSLQHHGTHRVAFMFAPIVTAWLLFISSIGVYNILKWNPHVIGALSPSYMLKFLRNTGIEGWVSLGGVVLSITGVETMFADLGHFSSLSIKVAFTFVVYPCLILAYMGEAAFLSRHHEDIQRSFYKAIPEAVFWPVFIVATFAAVVGSQAVISATFSIISQCCALNCFPRVKIVHTSSKIYGQIYIPEVNWMMMCLCLAVTIGLRDTNMMGHAYGLAVTTVMFVTTCLMSLVMIIVWKQRLISVVAFFLCFGSIELLYISASVYKVPEGGSIPLVLSSIFMAAMYIWNYGTMKKHEFDVENKVSMNRIVCLGPSLGMVRVPGIGLVYTNLITGVPAVFGHFVTNLPAFHQVLIFVCVKSVQVPYISEKERLLTSRVGPKEYGMFRCIVRYGYKDLQQENYDFENKLVSGIVQFVETEEENTSQTIIESSCDFENCSLEVFDSSDYALANCNHKAMEQSSSGIQMTRSGTGPLGSFPVKDESLQILRAKESGVAYILGHSYAKAKKSSSVFKKFAIDVVYAFLSTNCRGPDIFLNVPHTSLLEVGMIYHV